MATPLANKVSVITGAASGMGLATAKLFLSRGASLSLTGINSKGKNVKEFLDNIKAQFGHLNGIANVAVWRLPDEKYDMIMDTSVRGAFNFLRESLKPGYLEPSASVANVLTMFGLKGSPMSGSYVTSKLAVIGFTKAAAHEGGKNGNRVNAVGAILTPLMQDASEFGGNRVVNTPIPRVGEASEVASAIAFLLGLERIFVTGTIWAVGGGATA